MRQRVRALSDYAAAASSKCSEIDHQLCNGTGACASLNRVLESSDEGLEGVGADYVHHQGEPSIYWSTAQLLRLVSDNLRRLNVPDRLRRDTQITSALGKLADRGLSADAIIRTGFGPMLIDLILEGALAGRRLVLEGECKSEDLLLGKWVDILLSSPELRGVSAGDRGLGRTRAMKGAFAVEAQRWVHESPIAHLVAWRHSNEKSPAEDEDLTLLNGRGATVWVCERFTKTYLDQWASESLMWELTFLTDPMAVRSLAQFDSALLDERKLSFYDVAAEISRRTTSQIEKYQRGPMAELERAQQAVIDALDSGDMARAVKQAHANIDRFPNEPEIRRNFGFCIIGSDPERALETLMNYRPAEVEVLLSTLNHFNVIAASYRCNRQAPFESMQILIDGVPEGLPNESVWLWDPETLSGDPSVVPISLEEWRERMLGKLGFY